MKTELTPEDKQRIEQEAADKFIRYAGRESFILGAEYATIYEREQQYTPGLFIYKERCMQQKQSIEQLEAERSEMQSLLGDILAAHDQFGEITYLVDRIKNSLKK